VFSRHTNGCVLISLDLAAIHAELFGEIVFGKRKRSPFTPDPTADMMIDWGQIFRSGPVVNVSSKQR
jgi:hypothetical protein